MFFKTLKSKKNYIFATMLVLSVALLLPRSVRAGVSDVLIDSILGPICLWIVDFLGSLLIAIIQILISVAQYNDFINSPAVSKGWIILRDLCNMFFIVILLVIAFATVLGSEKYSYKKYLLPLILMAIMINFSKMIAGLFIDVSQVAMLQFVNGFKYAAAGNLTTAFGLNELLAMREISQAEGMADNMSSEVLISLLLAVAMLVTAVVVTGVILVVFLFRIIALWILVMLSPVAYMAQATPGAEQYSSMWWKEFSKYVIAGPVLAFFLWISLSIMAINPGNMSGATNINIQTENFEDAGFKSQEGAEAVAIGISKVGSSDRILSFIISIGMLIGSLVATQKLGVAGQGLAMAAKGKLETAGKRFAKVGLGIGALTFGGGAGVAAVGLGTKTGRKIIDYGQRKFAKRTGIETRPKKIWENIKFIKEKRARDDETAIETKSGELFNKGGVSSRFAIGSKDAMDHFSTGFLGMKGLVGKGGFFRHVPNAEEADKAGDELDKKKKEKETIDERLANGAVADGYMDELKGEKSKKANEAKALNTQIGEMNGDNLKKQAKTLREKADEAKKGGDENLEQNLNAQAQVLEDRSIEKAKEARQPEQAQKIQTLTKQRDDRIQEAQAASKRRKDLKGMGHDNREKEARVDLEIQKGYLEIDIARVKNSVQGDRVSFSNEQKEAFDKLTNDITKLTDEIDKWGKDDSGKSNAPKEDIDILKKKKKQLNEIGTAGDNQARIAILEAKRAELIGRTSGKTLSKEDKDGLETTRKEMQKEIDKGEKKLRTMRGLIPRDYYARQARRQAEAEEMRKIDTNEEDELIDLFESAVARKDKPLASAILKKVAGSCGLNSLINNHGCDSGPQGFNSFRKKVLEGELGMKGQESLGLQNDACEIAANQSNHLTFAKGVGIKNGRYVQMGGTMENPDPEGLLEQQYYAYVEMSKMDKETIARRFNRLGYGKEDSIGNFEFNQSGLWWMKDNWGTISNEIGRGRFNTNTAQKFLDPKAIAQLRGLVNNIPTEQIASYMDFLDTLNSFAKSGAPSMMSRKEEFLKTFS